LKGDKRRYELTIKGVGNLTNREWQGDKFKQDPCYLKLTKDVLGKKASTATFREDVSRDESGSKSGKRALDKKLKKIGYDDDSSDSSSSSESEESEGELLPQSFCQGQHNTHIANPQSTDESSPEPSKRKKKKKKKSKKSARAASPA
jgi:hypothetical protein